MKSHTFSDEKLWEKVKRFAAAAGKEAIEKVLWLYFALQKPETPKWAKTVIVGALSYFILPFDSVPDLLPAVGYTDDVGMLVAALATVSAYITDDIKQHTTQKLRTWFPSWY